MTYATIPDFSAGALTSAELNIVVDAINALFPVGFYGYMCRAATTAETLVNGVWLECNATSVLRATYPDLNTLLSGLSYPFGTVDGTHMTLPDAQGRALISMASGGHATADALSDHDALAKASRNLAPSVSVSISGTTGSHTHGAGSYIIGTGIIGSGSTGTTPVGGTPITGTSGASTASFSGSGSGTATIPYLVGGTLFIKAKA